MRLRETDYPGGKRYIVGPIMHVRQAVARTLETNKGAELVFEQIDYRANRATVAVQLPEGATE